MKTDMLRAAGEKYVASGLLTSTVAPNGRVGSVASPRPLGDVRNASNSTQSRTVHLVMDSPQASFGAHSTAKASPLRQCFFCSRCEGTVAVLRPVYARACEKNFCETRFRSSIVVAEL